VASDRPYAALPVGDGNASETVSAHNYLWEVECGVCVEVRLGQRDDVSVFVDPLQTGSVDAARPCVHNAEHLRRRMHPPVADGVRLPQSHHIIIIKIC